MYPKPVSSKAGSVNQYIENEKNECKNCYIIDCVEPIVFL